MDVFLGIDIGTGSARAGLFSRDGKLLGSAKRDITIWKDGSDIVEQSSEDIWSAIVASVKEAMTKTGTRPEQVKGIGFDATCSLVVLDADSKPLAVGPSGDPQRNIIVWMDHRAIDQANRINATAHPVLAYVGGRISPEMQVPKLLWLKENNRRTFDKAAHFFDLSDYLTYHATGALTRSLCTVVCKWTYVGKERKWDESFFRTIGLSEFADERFQRIGRDIADIATPLGDGLTKRAAAELGLLEGTPVGASLIDAHAGGVGTIYGQMPGEGTPSILDRMALIMGTSACTMSVTEEPAFVDGVWGPYWGAMLPGLWLNEGGQSAFGAAVDHIINMHPAFGKAKALAKEHGVSVPDYLEKRAIEKAGSLEDVAYLARSLQIVPEFLGNRAPEADPDATAAIVGLRLDTSLDSLVDLFVAALCGLSYGTADILDALSAKNIPLRTIVVSGGAARSALLRRILADSTQRQVALPTTPEPVLLGAAIIGAAAFERTDVGKVAGSMSGIGQVITARQGGILELHRMKRKLYRDLKAYEKAARSLMAAG